MTEDERRQRKQRIFRACMLALMAGSGTFLALRLVVSLGVEAALIAAAGVGTAVGIFLLQQMDRR